MASWPTAVGMPRPATRRRRARRRDDPLVSRRRETAQARDTTTRPLGWSAWRAAWRLAQLLPRFVGAGVVLTAVRGWPVPAHRAAWTQRLTRRLAAQTLRVLHVDVRRIGAWPAGPALHVANHLSWLDVLVLLVALPDVHLVAKREVATWPVVGSLAAAVHTVFVHRARRTTLPHTVRAIAERLRADRSVLLFAEGTTSDGTQVLPFRSSLFDAAVRTGRPVVPVGLRLRAGVGDTTGAPLLSWTGTTSLLRHLPLVAGTPRITCLLRAGAPLNADGAAADVTERQARSRARKRLAWLSQRTVQRLVVPHDLR